MTVQTKQVVPPQIDATQSDIIELSQSHHVYTRKIYLQTAYLVLCTFICDKRKYFNIKTMTYTTFNK